MAQHDEGPVTFVTGPSFEQSGGVLLSRRVAPEVPSAQEGLTSLFGMGRGVTPPLWPPKTWRRHTGAQTLVPARGHGPENCRAALKLKVKPSGN